MKTPDLEELRAHLITSLWGRPTKTPEQCKLVVDDFILPLVANALHLPPIAFKKQYRLPR